jgi:nickel/cobalt transporter (NicO) family protein
VVAGLLAVLVLPTLALAHPLGNFTINHYAGIRVEPDAVLLDVVVDQAEIPTFQARLTFDTDGDGEVSDAEADAGRVTECSGLAPSIELIVNDARQALQLTAAGLGFPPGVGGLSTMRVVCEYRAALATRLTTGSTLSFADTTFTDRLGWREIVVDGSGVIVSAVDGQLRTMSPSKRLTAYPTSQLAQAPADRTLVVSLAPGGAELAPFTVSDAAPVPGEVATPTSPRPAAPSAPKPAVNPAVGSAGGAPGGVTGAELPSIFREANLTPIVLLISMLTAGALGAGHALTPGHGKTLMAAYLVGSRGSVVHATGLGLSVAASHTIGILVLAALVLGAQDVLAPDVVARTAPLVAAVSFVGIGGWMVASEVRRRRRAQTGLRVAHLQEHPHEAEHEHTHADPHSQDEQRHGDVPHSHGGAPHSHLPVAGATITWRSLFVLGLAGGLIPSTSALLILLGSIAAGRAGFGFVLVVAFGLGMALVMGGIGIALVLARGRVDRMAPSSPLGRLSGAIPLVAAFLVLGIGIYLTAQAVGGAPVL